MYLLSKKISTLSIKYFGIFILLLSNSCTICNKQVNNLTNSELVNLSEDCKLMQGEITKRKKRYLKRNKQASECYINNDYLRKLLSTTNCFEGRTHLEIKKLFDSPNQQCLDFDLCPSVYFR